MKKKVEIEKVYSLSPMQQGMLFHWLMQKESPTGQDAYYRQSVFTLKGEIDHPLFEKSVNLLIERYEVLRTIFIYDKIQKPKQVILKEVTAGINVEDISHLDENQRHRYLETFKQKDRERGFDLTKDLLVRISFLETGPGSHYLVWSYHHIIMDGWCLGILFGDLLQFYLGLKTGKMPVLEPVVPYRTYIKWLENQDLKAGLTYWQGYLQDYLHQASLPGSFLPAAGNTYQLQEQTIIINESLSAGLKQLAASNQVTVSTFTQTLWGLLLQQYNNIDDVVFGSIVSGRPSEIPGIEKMVGLFINAVPIRIRTQKNQNFSQLLREIQKQSLLSANYEYLPQADIQAGSRLKGDLIDHIMIFENYPIEEKLKEDDHEQANSFLFKVEDYEANLQTNYHFNILVASGKTLSVTFNYNALVYEPAFIKRLGSQFEFLLRQVIENSQKDMGTIEILSKEEKHQLLVEFNDTETAYPKEKTIHELFLEQVERTPDHVALVGVHETQEKNFNRSYLSYMSYMSYQELNQKSNQLAYLLKEKGVGPDTIVGIMPERCIEMIIAIIGILKAGGAYLPIDPGYPEERINYMLSDSGTKVLVTAETLSTMPHMSYKSNKSYNFPRDTLAYIIYTSGSTGKPKGVAVRHKNAVNFISGIRAKIELRPGQSILALTTICFDIFFLETLLPLTIGMKIVISGEAHQKDPELLQKLIINNQIDFMQVTPSQLEQLLSGTGNPGFLHGITCLMVGGEAFPVHLLNRLKQELKFKGNLYNMYGPTETTVWSTIKDLNAVHEITIGTPIANTWIYILDRGNRLQPVNAVGELYIGGDGVASGYINNPELTYDKFKIKNEKLKMKNGAEKGTGKNFLYRTGDLARWLVNGEIQFLGRIDHQVKIRGYRIELAEIEKQLLHHNEIKQAIVIAAEHKPGDKYLCAYIVPCKQAEAGTSFPARFSDYLSTRLPGYMIPSFFVLLEKIPMTPNGKIDRKALPKPEIKAGEDYIAPRDKIEKKLAGIWGEILMDSANASIGIHDNFFHLGGHSLKITLLVSRIHKELEVKVPVAEAFNRPTIKKLAEFIKQTKKETFAVIEAVELKEYYPVSSAQKRVFILSHMENIGITYNMPFALNIQGQVDKARFEQTFRAILHRHESLRTSFHLLEDEPVQRIHEEVEFEIKLYDSGRQGDRESGNLLKNNSLMPESSPKTPISLPPYFPESSPKTPLSLSPCLPEFIKPFDLSRAPLLRVALVQQQEQKHTLLLDMHHIIFDGVSMAILVRDFMQLYNGEKPAALRVQYKDFSIWQNQLFASEVYKDQEKYWLEEQFKAGVPILKMPLDFKRPPKLTFAGHSITTFIPPQTTAQLNTLARQQDITLNILFFAIYAILLSLYSEEQDIVIGLLAAGRNHVDLEKIIGMFGNFLPIRSKINTQQTFAEIFASVKTTMLSAYDNQDYPFEKIVNRLSQSDPSRNPLFDTMLLFHNEGDITAAKNYKIKGLTFEVAEIQHYVSHLDFKLVVFPVSGAKEDTGTGTGFNVELQYNIQLFKKETIQGLLRHLVVLLEEAIRNPDQAPASIGLFTVEEKTRLAEKRKLNTNPPPPPPASKNKFKLTVSATFTADPVKDYTRWWCKKFNLEVEPQFAPYDQVFQQLIDENSPLSMNREGDVNLVLVRFEDWIRNTPASASPGQIIANLQHHFDQLITVVKEKTKTIPYFFGLFPGNPHPGLNPAIKTHIRQMNHQWREILETLENVYIIDFNEAIPLYGIEEVFDVVKDREGHMPFSDEFYAAMGTIVARNLVALKKPARKVIVLDCDNTLWQGICGEDGALGVQIREPYKQLQEFMLKKHDEGMLLALCSKNNEADVWEVFKNHPQMILQKNHLVAWRINWQPKPRNLEELAAELNLGSDSFIFLDDSPMECSQMMELCPDVLTLQLPGNPEEIPMFLKHVWAFDRLKVTAEDKNRTQMYQAEQKRQLIKNRIPSLQEFLKNLELKIKMAPIEASQIPRAAQLTQRTNQFNLSTRRRTESELSALLESPGITVWVVHAADRFGDYGLVGLVIGNHREKANRLTLDTFLLSCRVLGREVENAILVGLKKYCQIKQLTSLEAAFYPTAKNKPFREFLERSQWEKETEEDCTGFVLSLEKIPAAIAYIDCQFQYPL